MKTLISEMAQTLNNVDSALSESYSSFKAKFELDLLIKELTKIKSEVDELVRNEADNYPEKTFETHGLIIEKRNGAKRFDFKDCKIWSQKNVELKNIESTLKSAYEMYQRGQRVADENGEEIEIPKATYSKDVIIVREAK